MDFIRASRTAAGRSTQDGDFTRYQGSVHFLMCEREWASLDVNPGGTAEAKAFVPELLYGIKVIFLCLFPQIMRLKRGKGEYDHG